MTTVTTDLYDECRALGTNPRKSVKEGTGEVGVELEFSGVVFRVGARLYSDEDGTLVER